MTTKPTTPTPQPAHPGSAGTPAGRQLRIEHTYAEGTRLLGVRRGDELYRLLRSHGWLYRRSADDYRLQASQDRPAKTAAIDRTAAALREHGFTVAVQLDHTPRPVAEAEAERAQRADERADRLHTRAGRLAEQAAAREDAARRVLDHIPPGQPLLTDHHSYAGDRRRRERAHADMARSVELERAARHTAQAAHTAAAHMNHRYAVETVANRIDALTAQLRRIDRRRELDQHLRRLLEAGVPAERLGATPISDTEAAALAEREQHLRDQLTHWQQVRARQINSGTATDYSRDSITRGDLVQYRSSWHVVARTNAKSVSVPSVAGGSWNDTIRYERLTDHARPEDPRFERLKATALAQARAKARDGKLTHPAWVALTG